MKVSTYAWLSTLAFFGLVTHAYSSRLQFFSTAVYLYTSKSAQLVIGNFLFVAACAIGLVLKKMFLGSGGYEDVEAVFSDHLKSTLIDTLLMLTIFREDINARFIALFTALLFAKTFHWLADMKVEKITQATASFTWFSYVRLASLLLSLATVDAIWLYYSFQVTYEKGPSVLLLFLLEYSLLMVYVIKCSLKFILNVLDVQHEERWHQKEIYLMYIEFVMEILRFLTNLGFFIAILAYYGLPLHVIRPMYVSWRSFMRSLGALLNARKITRDMHRRFPDATADEMREAGMCIICRHEMQQAKKLPCGHVLHFWCLRDWLLQQDWCPMCHRPVNEIPAPLAREDGAPVAGVAGAVPAAGDAVPPQQQAEQPVPPVAMPMPMPMPFGFPPIPPHQLFGMNAIPPQPHTPPVGDGNMPPHFAPPPFPPFWPPMMMMMPPPPPSSLAAHAPTQSGAEAEPQTPQELIVQLQQQMAAMAEQLARLQFMLDQQQGSSSSSSLSSMSSTSTSTTTPAS